MAISALLEGESLFNDATSITLFEVFLGLVRRLEAGDHSDQGLWLTAYELVTRIFMLSIGAFPSGSNTLREVGQLRLMSWSTCMRFSQGCTQ